MIIRELPASWQPEGGLTVVAHVSRNLRELAATLGASVVADSDDFSAFRAIHIAVDEQPIAMIEYDPAPGYVYVLMRDIASAIATVPALFDRMDIGTRDVPWSAWRTGDGPAGRTS